VVELEVIRQQVQQAFHIAEGRPEELLDYETHHDLPFIGRGSVDPLPALPEWERIDVLPDACNG